MGAHVLEELKSEDFATRAAFLSTPSAIRRFLNRTPEVGAVRRGLREEAITEDSVRQFVSLLLRELRLGERFPHNMAVAALAVAFERRATDFASEFLHDLSRLSLTELSICIRVARECLKNRVTVVHSTSRHFNLGGNGKEPVWPSMGCSRTRAIGARSVSSRERVT